MRKMEKIVQLPSSEYDKLLEFANANEEEIEARAKQLWKEKAVAEIRITVDANTQSYATHTFDCSGYLFYKDGRFQIPSALRERLYGFIKDRVIWEIEYKYGEATRLIKTYKKKLNDLSNLKYILYGIAASGWATLVAYVCLS